MSNEQTKTALRNLLHLYLHTGEYSFEQTIEVLDGARTALTAPSKEWVSAEVAVPTEADANQHGEIAVRFYDFMPWKDVANCARDTEWMPSSPSTPKD